jgi:hypothetical protein
MPALDPQILTDGVGAFDELEELGHGTFGTTFRVVRGDDEYAIKVIHLQGLPPYLWERDIRALQAAEHPNVVAFRASGHFNLNGRDYPGTATVTQRRGDAPRE